MVDSFYKPFPLGSRVRKIRNPQKMGICIQSDTPTSENRQWVRWDNGETDEVMIRSLEVVSSQNTSTSGLIRDFRFANAENLRFALTQQRLSGLLSNMVYSLNLTNTEFLSYQFKPLLTFLRSRNNSLLIADEVGLGKTIEAGLIWTELQMREQAKRLLIICPSVLTEKWKFELRDKFNISADILNASELKQNLINIRDGVIGRCTYIVSLQSVRPPKNRSRQSSASDLYDFLNEVEDAFSFFDLAIIDEAHNIRHEETQSYKFIDAIRPLCQSIIMLSATPMQTSRSDLFTLIQVLDPDFFPSEYAMECSIRENERLVKLLNELARKPIQRHQFIETIYELELEAKGLRKKEFCQWRTNPPTEEELTSERGRARIVSELSKLNPLSQIISKTLKRDVHTGRVIREPYTVMACPTPAEREFYSAVVETIKDYCFSNEKPVGFATVMPERMVSSCPQAALIYWSNRCETEEDNEDSFEVWGDIEEEIEETKPLVKALTELSLSFPLKDELLKTDSKFSELRKGLINYWKEYPNKKVLLFSFFKKTLHHLHKQLKEVGIKSIVYDGDIPTARRGEVIEQFKNSDIPILLSSEIASEGIDLQFMNCIINYDLPWNPSKIEQRIGRIDRIGQKAQKISIINFIHKDTIDDRIYNALLGRLDIFRQALGLSEEILGKQIKELCQEIFRKDLSEIQVLEKIRQTQQAISNLEEGRKELEGQSVVFDMLDKEIKFTREMERYVTDLDLVHYIQTFCEKEGSGSLLKMLDKDERLYSLELSSKARSSFKEYLARQGSNLPPTRLLLEDIQIRIKNKVGKEPLGIERMTQNHSFIQFITWWLKEQKKTAFKTSACRLKSKDLLMGKKDTIQSGRYFFSIVAWTTTGVGRESVRLFFRIINLDNQKVLNEEESEVLINSCSLNGFDWPAFSIRQQLTSEVLIAALDLNQEALDEEFEKFSQREEDLNYSIAEYQKLLLETQIRKEEACLYKRLEEIDNEEDTNRGKRGRQQRFINDFNKKKKKLEQRKEEIQLKAENFKVREDEICTGIIEVI